MRWQIDTIRTDNTSLCHWDTMEKQARHSSRDNR